MLKIPSINRFSFVPTLPEETQQTIKRAVTEALTATNDNTEENIENALSGKVVDLEDTIQIKYI